MNIKGDRTDAFFENLRLFGEAADRNGIPMWTTLLSTGHYNYRCPTEDDLRWQLNNAAIHGAKGVMWWFLYQHRPYDSYRLPPVDELGGRTETFGWLSRTDRTFLRAHADLLFGLERVGTMHATQVWGGFPGMRETDLVRRVSSRGNVPMVVSEFRDRQGARYVAMLNDSMREPTRAALVLKGEGLRLSIPAWKERDGDPLRFRPAAIVESFADHAVWYEQLAPGQMEIARVETGGGS
jgi:hypothetical protein